MDEPQRFPRSSRKFARAQRRDMTRAETMLWRALRNHQIDGHGFRRQTPIGPYFADFVCLARKIIVEADGRTHESADEGQGWREGRMAAARGISRVAISRRSCHRRVAHRRRAHSRRPSRTRAPASSHCMNRQREPSTHQTCFPHPIRPSATFPAPRRRGFAGRLICVNPIAAFAG